jgi:peptidoglycan/LPS O-acetylase OafA/YrhL
MDQRTKFQLPFSKPHLPALDGVRAVAVFLVIFYHFGIPHVPGGHGVMIFFVLSGFLITWLLIKENEKNGTISLTGFYKRRTLRIFPAFYVYWFLLVGYFLLSHKPVLWPHAWSAFFYTSNYYNAIKGDPNTGFSHTWSLAIEEQFYLLWPLGFLLLRRNLARASLYLVVLIAAVWVHRIILCFVFNVSEGYIYAAFDTRLDDLMMGCLVAVLIRNGSLSSFWHAATSHMLLPLIPLALLIASIFIGNAYVYRYRDVYGFAIEPLLIAVLLVQLIVLSQTPLWSWSEWRILKFLGRISYSLYLYQQVTLPLTKRALSSYPVILQLIAAVLTTITAATISYYFIERPFLKLKRRDRGSRQSSSPSGKGSVRGTT